MRWNESLRKLAATLATLYPTEADARRVVDEAGIPAGRIAFSGQAAASWHAVVVEADKQDMLPALVAVALDEYPRRVRALAEAIPPADARALGLGPSPAAGPLVIGSPGESDGAGAPQRDPDAASLFVSSELWSATLPVRVRLDHPAGLLLDSVIAALGLPARLETAGGRIGLGFRYALVLAGRRSLVRARPLAAQGVRDGDTLVLETTTERLAATRPARRRDDQVIFRGDDAARAAGQAGLVILRLICSRREDRNEQDSG